MVFPQDVLDTCVELNLSGTWTDITDYVQRRDSLIQVTRGRANESGRVDRSTCTFSVRNTDGRFSPRNPTGPYYGVIGRNTPVRVSVRHGDRALTMPGPDSGVTSGAVTTDKSTLDITGDIDMRIEVDLYNWRDEIDLIAKYGASGQRSYAMYMTSFNGQMGFPAIRWSANGTTELQFVCQSPVPIPATGRMALRVTLDVDNGASGCTARFYTSDSIGGSWTQLGPTLVAAGTTSIFSSSANLEIGRVANISFDPMYGKVYAAEVRNTIGGTVVANPNFTAQTEGATSFADTAGTPNTWTVNSGSEVTNKQYRFHGEVPSWPVRWDPTGTDVYVPVEASGVLRRLNQGDAPVQSALYRGYVRLSGSNAPVAYWPCEDEDGSQTIASATNGPPMTVAGQPGFSEYTGFNSSKPIPYLNDSEWTGVVPAYTVTGSTSVRFLLAIPATGISGDQVLMTLYTSGTAAVWKLRYEDPTGGLQVEALDSDGTSILTSGFVSFTTEGQKLRVSLDFFQNGSNIDWDLSTLGPETSTGSTFGATLNSYTFGRVERIVVSPGGGINDTAIGHISVQSATPSIFDLRSQLGAYVGEAAATRFERICQEEGITYLSVGENGISEKMGPQFPAKVVDILNEVATTDDGMMFEPRSVFGLGYRSRNSMYNQLPRVTLVYDDSELSGSLEPEDDDQMTRNDITVQQQNGSSYRASLDSGALSTQAPPNGVGRYDDSITVNVAYDEQLIDQVYWRLLVGTTDEIRYPQITVDMSRSAVTSNSDLEDSLFRVDQGDRLVIENPPLWLPPDDISQIVQGYTESMGNFEHSLTFNCSPESPYHVGTYDTSRYGPWTDTVTNEALDSTETGVDVNTPTGPLWTTTPGGNFDIMIGGERMTVTAIGSATGTVQTLTVVRSVNGVAKSHASGSAIRFVDRATRAMGVVSTSAVDREIGNTIASADTPRTVYSRDLSQLTNLSNSMQIGTPEIGVRFVAPSTGRVLITVGGGARDATNDGRIFFAPQVLADNLVDEVLAAAVAIYGYGTPGSNSDYVFGSRTGLLSGLTPGRTYYARVMVQAETTSADLIFRDISVEPVS